jgi:putative two-component system response regulator
MPVILIVDDTPENLSAFSELLMPLYTVRTVTSGERALKSIRKQQPDLVLLDILMPGMNGYEVINAIKSDRKTADIPVIFLTALGDAADEAYGLSLGALDYIIKPINPAITLIRIKTHIDLKFAKENLNAQRTALDLEMARRADDVHVLQEMSIRTLRCIAELRDADVGSHMQRTQNYMRVLCSALRERPEWRDRLSEEVVYGLIHAVPLHDIGKIAIPDYILRKGGLSVEEEEMLRMHTLLGSYVLARIGAGASVPMLDIGRTIAAGHHERWDGTGYPRGLVGEGIPVPARIMALVDRFDSLITEERPPGEPASQASEATRVERAVSTILMEQSTAFDPSIVDAFSDCAAAFRTLALGHLEQIRQAVPETVLTENVKMWILSETIDDI